MDVNYSATGIVFDIQRFSIHDGPGIRTIVFLKGCPLSCLWCCNPESQKLQPVIMFQSDKCINCGSCVTACKRGAIKPDSTTFIDREICNGCGECANVCPSGALTVKGKKMNVQQIIKELKKDAINYRRSGGGITLSGGEPMLQHSFAAEILKACKSQGWHTAIETTGYTKNHNVIEEMFPYIDLALMDIKSTNEKTHIKFTGISNDMILKNAKRISEITKTVIRIPTINGVNAKKEDMEAICNFAKTLHGIDAIHILPYHTYGENKYTLLNREYLMRDTKSLTPEKIEELKMIVEQNGFRCVIGG